MLFFRCFQTKWLENILTCKLLLGKCIYTCYNAEYLESWCPSSSVGSGAINPGVLRLNPSLAYMFDKMHCDKHLFSSANWRTAYGEKQSVAWKTVVWTTGVSKPGKHMARWTGHSDMTEKLLKMSLTPNNQMDMWELTSILKKVIMTHFLLLITLYWM